jgi:glucose/arabinose dehydrogenase
MLITFATLVLLALFVSIGVYGANLVRQPGTRRVVGAILVLQALLLIAAQVALSTLPFGIGDPLIRVPFWPTLLQASGSVAAIGAAALVYLASRWIGQRLPAARRPRLATTGALLAVPLVAALGLGALVRASTPERERERDPNKREITLSPGFTWSIYAQGTMDNPTAIAFGPQGELYIADIGGSLWVATDADGDHVAETIKRWADGFSLLVGLVWHEGELYAASSGKIEALRDTDGDGIADQRRVVVEDLPSMVLKPHSNNGLAFGPDGRLYFGVGSTTNGELESNPLAAAILSVNPDGSDLKVYARGLGNSFDVAFNANGDLFAGDNSPMGGEGEELPDEFNHIVEGGHYGFPYFYGDPPSGSTRAPLVSLPPHSVPTGVTFYSGALYPPEYRDSAFLTLWSRGEIARIEVGRTDSGRYLSRAVSFGSGFLYPIDVITGPDDNLYVADFGTSAVYRITYDAANAR